MNKRTSTITLSMRLFLVVTALTMGISSQAMAGAGWGDNVNIAGQPIKVPTYYANSPSGFRPDPFRPMSTINTGKALRKFIDPLPGICGPAGTPIPTVTGGNGTPLSGKCIQVANPDTTTYPGSDYYEIGIVEYSEYMHGDLLNPTRLRGYVQLNDPANPVTVSGGHVISGPQPHYLGPTIVAQRKRPVRIKFSNLLPTGAAGNLFIPVDKTLMGAGNGPDGTRYSENRAEIHLHGGDNPWISDGTPHQWTVPAGETTTIYLKGDSFQNVPDMADPGAGSGTLYFPNGDSARLMFYHDHASGITRLNVYAGEAAGYLLQDPVEADLVARNVIPADIIPLVIQDKTFVPKDIALQDAKWNMDINGNPVTAWGQESDLWFPHVYETNQDPNSIDGTNPVGRWDWGPWFWPVFPSAYSLPTGYYGDETTTPEAFMDTPVVNGTAYPTLTVDPRAYRFRILNAANDRFLNLGLYVADSSVVTDDGRTNTEVKMVPFVPGAAAFPDGSNAATAGLQGTGWGTPDARVGGVPDPATAGPDIIQIGTEGGFLPNPVVIPSTPINYEYNKRSVTVLNVLERGLYLGNAERADVVVDFSAFAGKTLILYNDAPAPVPASDPRIDYYTGNPDFSASGGAYPTVAGYGPNTRTIMQIVVNGGTGVPFVNTLATELPKAYGASQPAPIVPESAYNAAFGTTDSDNFATIYTGSAKQPMFRWTPSGAQSITKVTLTGGGTGYTSAPAVVFNVCATCAPPITPAKATASVDPVTRMVKGIVLDNPGTGYTSAPVITFVGGGGIGATASVTTTLTQELPVQNKAIQELFEPNYGRMNATLGVELPFTSALTQTTIPLAYIDPTTESIADGETQIWKITHNGVDTHPVHFHLVNVQVINRIGWDGTIKPPYDNEVGWKETVKMNPLEDIVVAVRAKAPLVPFNMPESVRLLDPTQKPGSMMGFTQIDPATNNPKVVMNDFANFGFEYVWHCHILGHEENDFMRPFVLTGAHNYNTGDTQAPMVTATVTPAPNANGWNKSGVTVNLSATDLPLSPAYLQSGVAFITYRVDAGAAVKVAGSSAVVGPFTTDGTYAVTFSATDNAATPNTSVEQTITVKVDSTLPTLSFQAQSPAANANGWNNTPVTIAYTAADALSGLLSTTPASPLSFASQGANQTSVVTVVDNAGNTATFISPAVSIDTTAPVVTATRTPAANAAGWNNTNVTVTFAASDALSGVAAGSLTAPITLSAQGAGQSATGSATDRAGNTGSVTVSGINIDTTAPTVTAAANPQSVNRGGGTTAVIVSGTVTDALSGPGATGSWRLTDSKSATVATGTFPIAANGSYSFTRNISRANTGPTIRTYTFTITTPDKAGNNGTATTTFIVR